MKRFFIFVFCVLTFHFKLLCQNRAGSLGSCSPHGRTECSICKQANTPVEKPKPVTLPVTQIPKPFLNPSNSSTNFKDGGTLDFSTPSQKELEKRANAQNMANKFFDASNNLKNGQQKVLDNTFDKIRDNQSQISDNFQAKDHTGILGQANNNEVNVDDLTLSDLEEIDNSEDWADKSNFLLSEPENYLREVPDVGKAILNIEELSGVLGSFGQGTGLSPSISSIVEARTGQGSAAEEILDSQVSPGLKCALDPNCMMSDAEIDRMGTNAENTVIRHLFDHTPAAPLMHRASAILNGAEQTIQYASTASQIFEDLKTVAKSQGTGVSTDVSNRLYDAWDENNTSYSANTVRAGMAAAYFMMDNYYGAQAISQSVNKLGDVTAQYYTAKSKQGFNAMQKWFFD